MIAGSGSEEDSDEDDRLGEGFTPLGNAPPSRKYTTVFRHIYHLSCSDVVK
jgi:hypothetical protein